MEKKMVSSIRIKLIQAVLSLLIIASGVSQVIAADKTLVPSLGITGAYDDNITFIEEQEISDYAATISPALKFDYLSGLVNLSSYAALDILRYLDENTYDNENYNFGLKGSYQLTEKMRVKGDFSYLKDTTLDSYLEETGLVERREDVKSYNLAGGFSYVLSGLSDMDFNYAFQKRDYDFNDSVDYDRNDITLSFNRRLKSRRDSIIIQPIFSNIDSDSSEVDDYGLSAGWEHQPHENYRLRVLVGGRYTRITPAGTNETDGNFGVTTDISLDKRGETYSIMAAYGRNLYYSSFGEAINVDRIYFILNRQIARRLSAGFRGSFYKTVSEREVYDSDNKHIELVPSLIYQITKQHKLELGYNYSWQKDESFILNDKITRSKVWVTLSLNFPKKF